MLVWGGRGARGGGGGGRGGRAGEGGERGGRGGRGFCWDRLAAPFWLLGKETWRPILRLVLEHRLSSFWLTGYSL